jgi:hypothetical protein
MPRAFTLLLGATLALATSLPSQTLEVFRLRLTGQADLASLQLVERALDGSRVAGAVALVVELALAGGSDAAAEAIAARFAEATIPVFVLLARGAGEHSRAPALAADSVFVAGDAADAMPIGVSSAGTVRDVAELLERMALGDAAVTVVDAGWLTVTVQVTNRNWRDLRIYLIRAGTRQRLGMVTSMNTKEFAVPHRLVVPGASMHVLAEVVGSTERVRTEEVRVERGLVIDWLVANVIIESTYFISYRP